MSLPKIKITRAGGYDPALGPEHPANRDPTLEAHVFEIQTQAAADPVTSEPVGVFRYRWRCSCEKTGPWQEGSERSGTHAAASRRARRGGLRHVAAMERGA